MIPSRYVLGGELGRGGMGIVYRAADAELDREVALKVGEGNDMFLREAQLTGQLEHPNIVPVHDTGVTADGRLFFTMKIVGGSTWQSLLRQDRTLRRHLNILMKVCDAVAFAHARGVVHRDLKPANVMVGEFGEVLVMDWGLADVANLPDVREPVAVRELGESMDGAIVGTPSYMSPEQARGERVDARADVFALGAMLYQALTGDPPYTGKDAWDVLDKARAGVVVSPKEAPPELAAIAMKALSPGRYAGAKEFQDDLRRYLEGREVSARRDPAAVRAAKWVRRHPASSAAIAATMLALGAGLGGFEMLAAARQRAEAAALEREAALLPDTVEGMARAEELLRSAQEMGAEAPARFDVNAKLAETALAGKNYALARLAFGVCAQLRPDRAAEFERRLTQAERQESQDRRIAFEEALADIGGGLQSGMTVEDHVLDIVGFKDEQTVRLLGAALESAPDRNLRTFALTVLGRTGRDDAVDVLAAAMERLEDPEGQEECARALCHTSNVRANGPLTSARKRLGLNSSAWLRIQRHFWRVPEPTGPEDPLARGLRRIDKGLYLEALPDLEAVVERNPGDAGARLNRGIARQALGDRAGASEDFGRAIELAPHDAAARNNRGTLRQASGDLDGAVEDFSRAVELDSKFVLAWVNRGAARFALRDMAGAIGDYGQAILLDPRNAASFTNRGNARAEQGDLPGAIQDFNRALELDRTETFALSNRAVARQRSGDAAGAVEDFTEAIDLEPLSQPFYIGRGVARHAVGDVEGAVEDFSRAIELNPDEARGYYNRGIVRQELADLKGAIEDFSVAIEKNRRDPDACVNRGNARYQLGDVKGAVDDWKEALRRAPEDPRSEGLRRAIRANDK